MKRFLLALLLSTVLGHAASLTQLTIFPEFFVPSNGTPTAESWTNNLGFTIYIKRFHIYMFPGSSIPSAVALGGGFSGNVKRMSDGSSLAYWAWAVNNNTIGSGPDGTTKAENYAPDAIQVDPGDTLKMTAYSGGFGGVRSALSGWIWYTTTP